MKIKYLIKENTIRAGDYCYFRKGNGSFSFCTYEIDMISKDKVHFKVDTNSLWYKLEDVKKGDKDSKNPAYN